MSPHQPAHWDTPAQGKGKKKKEMYIRIIQVYIKHNNGGKAIKMVTAAGSQTTYVLEASIERLKLLPGELGLSLQLVQPLRLVTHRRQLQITVAAVCGRKRKRERKGWIDRKREREREVM